MTNTIKFHGIIRDDASTATTSSSDISVQQLPTNDRPSSSSSLLFAAINAMIPRRSDSSPGPWSESDDMGSGKMKVFSFKELKTATRNFHPDDRLGEGDFGPVFKGWIDANASTATKPGKGIVVAVKSLRVGSVQGHKEWLNYNAKLSDFGLARGGPTDGMSHVSTRVVGTHGSMALEYLLTGHLTAKSDVYSFGVVLLETLSGRRMVDLERAYAEDNQVDWARPYLSNPYKIFHILDSHLEGQCSLGSAEKAANLILRCLAVEAKLRPSMDEVVITMQLLQDP